MGDANIDTLVAVLSQYTRMFAGEQALTKNIEKKGGELLKFISGD